MIYGIGVDMVRIGRIQAALDRFGEAFAHRILAAGELEGFLRSNRRASFLAKRFAAKEAVVKAFGTGFREGIGLRHIGVVHDELGRPSLFFTDRAGDVVRERNINASHLSLCDEEGYAIAFVILLQASFGN